MKLKVCFIERKAGDSPSIERVFRQISKDLSKLDIETAFVKLPYGNGIFGMFGNLLLFRPPIADILHLTGHAYYMGLVLPPEKTVVTIHDLGILRIRKGPRRLFLKKLLFELPLRRLKFITAISGATKKDLIEKCKARPESIHVIEDPLNQEFVSRGNQFNPEEPVILQIGTAPHKNLNNVVRAIKSMKCRLFIVGPLDARTCAFLVENGIVYENLPKASDTQMLAAYEKSDIVIFCSTFEGFGLPIIEAQAMRKPLITSNTAPMNDVAGNGAILVDPANPESIRTAIVRLVGDVAFRTDLVEKGFENVKRFDGSKIAGKYRQLYKEMIAAAV